ncbi:MAG: PilZ domain-containing protein [Gammaproteobacteria bacterium]
MLNEKPEKRRFFRIDDTISLTYQLIDEGLANAGMKTSGTYALAATLDLLSQETLRIVQGLEKQSDPMLELFKVLDAKINALAQTLMFTSSNIDTKSCRDVNLSASGVAFEQEEPLDIGQYLAVEMYLPATLALLLVYGKVVKCETRENGLYLIGVDFTDIKEEDQELLIKHVVRKQWRQLQENRSHFEGKA